jgi:hypothetical protein
MMYRDIVLTNGVSVRNYQVRDEIARIIFMHGMGETKESFEYLGDLLAQRKIQLTVLQVDSVSNTSRLNRLDNVEYVNRWLVHAINLARQFGRELPTFVGGQCAGSSHAATTVGLLPEDTDPFGMKLETVSGLAGLILLGPQVPQLAGLNEDSYMSVTAPQVSVVASEDWNFIPGGNQSLTWAHITSGSENKRVHTLDGGWHNAFTDSDPWYPVPPVYARQPEHHEHIAAYVAAFVSDIINSF